MAAAHRRVPRARSTSIRVPRDGIFFYIFAVLPTLASHIPCAGPSNRPSASLSSAHKTRAPHVTHTPSTSHKRVAPTLATRRLASSRRPHAHLSSHRTLRPIPTRANSHVRPVVCATHGAICPGTNALRTRSGQSGGPPPRRNHAAVGRAPCAREHRCSHAHPIQLPRAARRARLGPLCGRLPPHCPSRRRRRGHCPGRSP